MAVYNLSPLLVPACDYLRLDYVHGAGWTQQPGLRLIYPSIQGLDHLMHGPSAHVNLRSEHRIPVLEKEEQLDLNTTAGKKWVHCKLRTTVPSFFYFTACGWTCLIMAMTICRSFRLCDSLWRLEAWSSKLAQTRGGIGAYDANDPILSNITIRFRSILLQYHILHSSRL